MRSATTGTIIGVGHPREAPTLRELLEFARRLPADQAKELLRRARPAPPAPADDTGAERPDPAYTCWAQYLAGTTAQQRLRWCRAKARTANRSRLMSGTPDQMITTDDVWQILQAAQGGCEYCGSLAVEGRPSGPDGRPTAWAPVGRRIGSLGHRVARFNRGSNDVSNLGWCCLWCNTWPSERRPGATDHGGVHP